ncbi:DUF4389 domain-containing protein [Pseudomonas sp. RIT-PI-AD]|uniref:DUF4389 domain-containing protein n=1 Tax=Pseudomonas sp. RIT-PI-AD TaxID=3035294 RepID=UPI0021DB18CA|nr:DUF4389 domain-containing protein [Pseudomonas sp. RIT-PI-AD]
MSEPRDGQHSETLLLRILWMVIFVIVWQVAELVLVAVVLLQLGHRLIYAAPNAGLLGFGDSLSQYLAQIGRFGTFNTERKPWPFADWPAPRPVDGDAGQPPPAVPAADEAPRP